MNKKSELTIKSILNFLSNNLSIIQEKAEEIWNKISQKYENLLLNFLGIDPKSPNALQEGKDKFISLLQDFDKLNNFFGDAMMGDIKAIEVAKIIYNVLNPSSENPTQKSIPKDSREFDNAQEVWEYMKYNYKEYRKRISPNKDLKYIYDVLFKDFNPIYLIAHHIINLELPIAAFYSIDVERKKLEEAQKMGFSQLVALYLSKFGNKEERKKYQKYFEIQKGFSTLKQMFSATLSDPQKAEERLEKIYSLLGKIIGDENFSPFNEEALWKNLAVFLDESSYFVPHDQFGKIRNLIDSIKKYLEAIMQLEGFKAFVHSHPNIKEWIEKYGLKELLTKPQEKYDSKKILMNDLIYKETDVESLVEKILKNKKDLSPEMIKNILLYRKEALFPLFQLLHQEGEFELMDQILNQIENSNLKKYINNLKEYVKSLDKIKKKNQEEKMSFLRRYMMAKAYNTLENIQKNADLISYEQFKNTIERFKAFPLIKNSFLEIIENKKYKMGALKEYVQIYKKEASDKNIVPYPEDEEQEKQDVFYDPMVWKEDPKAPIIPKEEVEKELEEYIEKDKGIQEYDIQNYKHIHDVDHLIRNIKADAIKISKDPFFLDLFKEIVKQIAIELGYNIPKEKSLIGISYTPKVNFKDLMIEVKRKLNEGLWTYLFDLYQKSTMKNFKDLIRSRVSGIIGKTISDFKIKDESELEKDPYFQTLKNEILSLYGERITGVVNLDNLEDVVTMVYLLNLSNELEDLFRSLTMNNKFVYDLYNFMLKNNLIDNSIPLKNDYKEVGQEEESRKNDWMEIEEELNIPKDEQSITINDLALRYLLGELFPNKYEKVEPDKNNMYFWIKLRILSSKIIKLSPKKLRDKIQKILEDCEENIGRLINEEIKKEKGEGKYVLQNEYRQKIIELQQKANKEINKWGRDWYNNIKEYFKKINPQIDIKKIPDEVYKKLVSVLSITPINISIDKRFYNSPLFALMFEEIGYRLLQETINLQTEKGIIETNLIEPDFRARKLLAEINKIKNRIIELKDFVDLEEVHDFWRKQENNLNSIFDIETIYQKIKDKLKKYLR